MMACRHTTVPEMFNALETKIMFWAFGLFLVLITGKSFTGNYR
jgi:hypothetical protein